VAILRYHPELEAQAIQTMQRHDETDEVFVLLNGRFILFIGEGGDEIDAISAVDLQPLKAYNVKKGAWHTHTLSHDAMVLIVENQDTRDANSPTRALTPEQRSAIVEQMLRLWG
jgi:ureidoglycolate hydrolase